MDATPVNRSSFKAPQMYLPSLHDILTRFSKRKYFASVDAFSYFYQFPLCEEVSRVFSFEVNKRRGAPQFMSLQRMAMGWLCAPAVGQRTSRLILHELRRRLQHLDYDSDVWLDNFLFAADTDNTLCIVINTFLTIADEINLRLHPVVGPSSHLEALGFTLTHGAIVHKPSWVANVRSSIAQFEQQPHATHREIAKIIGNAIWAHYARRRPISLLPHCLRAIRALTPQGSWDDLTTNVVTTDLLDELHAVAKWLDTPFSLLDSPVMTDPSFDVFSDAARDDYVATWAFTFADTYSQAGCFDTSRADEHIFLLELRAAMHALASVASQAPHAHVRLGIDNTPAMFALRAGHSGNAVADTLLCRFFSTLPATFVVVFLSVFKSPFSVIPVAAVTLIPPERVFT